MSITLSLNVLILDSGSLFRLNRWHSIIEHWILKTSIALEFVPRWSRGQGRHSYDNTCSYEVINALHGVASLLQRNARIVLGKQLNICQFGRDLLVLRWSFGSHDAADRRLRHGQA
jgi:hypothetical protein